MLSTRKSSGTDLDEPPHSPVSPERTRSPDHESNQLHGDGWPAHFTSPSDGEGGGFSAGHCSDDGMFGAAHDTHSNAQLNSPSSNR